MKILRLTTLMDFGGQERKYISFTENSNILNHHYVFAAIGYGGNAEKLLKERGFEVHILNRNFSIKNISNIWAVYQLIKRVNPDIVHTAAGEANFHGIIAAKLAGVKIIIGEEIGIPSHSKIAQRFFKQVYSFAKKVICVSEAVKRHLNEIGEIITEKGVVIYNPANAPTDSHLYSDPNVFNIVYVGRLEKVKNVEMLLHAFNKIDNTNIHLTIVGEGRERENLEGITNHFSLNENVTFTGFSQNPHQFLEGADLFVLPSFSEGFGIAVVEAMLMKVPVLCSNVGGIPEFVKDNENGWLFNPLKEDELVEKLNTILAKNKIDLREIGLKGYNDVNNVFTVEKYVENLENLYERLAKED
jgi:glycosyltransferase involved in cell wall biosynthesis